MQVFGPQSLNKRITLAAIQECVDVLELTEADTIRLHPYNFDSLATEYRDKYGYAMPEPFFVAGVWVEEARPLDQPRDNVVVYFNDERARPSPYPTAPSLADDDRLIYRCGFCGNLVDEKGRELDQVTRALHIKILECRGQKGVRHREGDCCPNGHNS